MENPIVFAVCTSPTHSMAKPVVSQINLLEGIGVEGDAHSGEKAKHIYIAKRTPEKPNNRQVHLIHSELHNELNEQGFSIKPGEMGENITTKGIDLLNLPENTILEIGSSSIIKITGLREPCSQLNGVEEGLLKAVIDRDKSGKLILKSGIMAVVLKSGPVKAGDKIEIKLPKKPHVKLAPI